jgi:hypothetical protein
MLDVDDKGWVCGFEWKPGDLGSIIEFGPDGSADPVEATVYLFARLYE